MKQYSYEEIYEARKIAAKIVSLHGDVYLPIFNRLHKELLEAEDVKTAKELALKIARQGNEFSEMQA